jgi:hypothetical protein
MGERKMIWQSARIGTVSPKGREAGRSSLRISFSPVVVLALFLVVFPSFLLVFFVVFVFRNSSKQGVGSDKAISGS